LVAYSYTGTPIYAKDLQVEGAMAALMKDAINPNLVQTLENTPAIIHGGPFANIAHGCNSVRATKLAMKLADYTITEAGFGSDLGAEKFLDIKCRYAGIQPSCVVLVATIRALKYNGGVPKDQLTVENVEALQKGICNLGVHIENMKKYGVPVVVAINHFATDSEAEIALVREYCAEKGASCAFSDVFLQGGEGGIELAEKVIEACEQENHYAPLYDEKLPIAQKLDRIVTEIYRASGVSYSAKAKKAMKDIEALGLAELPICVAKTQYSLTDDPKQLGAPTGFEIHVSDMKVSAGAGFIVVYTGDIMTMPGLPKVPAAMKIDIDAKGNISGLF
jgi:formate--tetrahydrofolate ligase